MKWLEILNGSERRLEARQADPSILAYYWDGSVPTAHQVRDISAAGAFVNTKERWYIGTLVRLTLVRDLGFPVDPRDEEPESETISMFAKTIRHEEDGVGVEFVTTRAQGRTQLRDFLARASASPAPTRSAAEGGQALVEFALVLPLVILFIVNAINFGGYLYAWITVANAARAGAQYEVLGGASVGYPNTPSSSQVGDEVTTDTYSLPNKTTLAVNVCITNNQASPYYTCSCAVGTCGTASAPPTFTSPCTGSCLDPESPYYVSTWVDVTYTYKPFISLWDFSALGIHATLPATKVHRRAVMRIIQ